MSDVVDDLRFKLEAHRERIAKLEAQIELLQGQLAHAGAEAVRMRLPKERQSTTHHFTMGYDGGEVDIYVIVGFFENGRPGEVFVRAAKMGGVISGFLDAWAVAVSLLLQRGEALDKIVEKYRFQQFEPAGFVKCGDLRFGATSLVDAIVRVLEAAHLRNAVAV